MTHIVIKQRGDAEQDSAINLLNEQFINKRLKRRQDIDSPIFFRFISQTL